jgi:hypothetical protein
MNSLGVSPYVNWLYSDLADGLIIFQVRFLRLDQRSLHPLISNKASQDSHVSAGARARVSAVGGEHSAKELASQLIADYSEPLFCIFLLAD